MLTSAFSGAGEAPGAHLCTPPGTGRNRLPLPSTLGSPASGPLLNPPPSAARGHASRPRPLPGAGHGAAGRATAPREAPEPHGTAIPRIRAPTSHLPLLGNLHSHLYALRCQKERKWFPGGSRYKGRRAITKHCATSTPVAPLGNVVFMLRKAFREGEEQWRHLLEETRKGTDPSEIGNCRAA